MYWLGNRARQSWENFAPLLLVYKVASDRPARFCLPPGVVYQNMGEVLVNPVDSVRVTPLSHKQEAMQRAGVILLDPISFVVLFLDNSDTSRCHVKTIHLVLLHSVPNNPRVWSHWLSFKEHALGSSDEGSIYYEAMADHPTNITRGEVNSALLDIEDMRHAEIQSNSCTACLSCDSFWLASGA